MVAEVGSIRVGLTANSEAFGRQMGAAAGSVDRFGRKANSSLSLVQRRTEALKATVAALPTTFSALSRVGGVLAGLGISLGAVATLKRFVDATITQQKAVAQLEQVIKSTGGAAGLTSRELLDMAGALQKVTTYGDEATIAAQSILLTFTSIGRDVFPDALATVLDMSTALGQDLKASAIQVGKALQDPIIGVGALRKVGVNFSAAQAEVIKKLVETGHAADAQRLILKELSVEFGGSARAARDTLGGALAALQNALGDLFEVGSDGSARLVGSIEDLTRILSDPTTVSAAQALGTAIFDSMGDALRAVKDLAFSIDALKRGDLADAFGIYINDPTRAASRGLRSGTVTAPSAARAQADTNSSSYDAFGSTFAAPTAPARPSAPAPGSAGTGTRSPAAAALDIRPTIDSVTAGVSNLDATLGATADSLSGFFADMRSGLKQGETVWEAFGTAATNALDRLTEKLLGMAEDQVINGLIGALRGIVGGVGGSISPVVGGVGIGTTLSTLYHGGGRVGAGGTQRRVPSSLFAAAPRFHSGLQPNEQAAIFKRGETVLTEQMAVRQANTVAGLSQLAKGGGGGGLNIHVDVTEAPGHTADVHQNQDGGLEVIIRKVEGRVAKSIAGNGVVGKAIGGSFDVKRRRR